ncbi:DNA-processing protein DprA, partial [Streptosporangium longisporum]
MNDRLARLVLMRLAEPGDAAMGALVALRGPRQAVDLVREGVVDADLARRLAGGAPDPHDVEAVSRTTEPPRQGADLVRHGTASSQKSAEPVPVPVPVSVPVPVAGRDGSGQGRDGRLAARAARLDRTIASWAARLKTADPERDLAEGERIGARLVIPGDPEWPSQLDDLGASRPYALWVYGDADLRFSCLRSVAVVGSRAATPYGTHVATEFGAGLSEKGWHVISGGVSIRGMTTPRTRCVIYVRISRDKEGAGLGVQRQEHECRQ